MDESRNAVLVCLSGLDTQMFIERAAPHIPHGRRLVLLYVIDTRPAEELGYIGRKLHMGQRSMQDREAAMSAADEDTAGAVLNEAEQHFISLGYAPDTISRSIRKGRPEQLIIEVAKQPDLAIGLVVVGSSYKRDPRPLTGPESVGHVARFVVDHSPCDVLLLR